MPGRTILGRTMMGWSMMMGRAIEDIVGGGIVGRTHDRLGHIGPSWIVWVVLELTRPVEHPTWVKFGGPKGAPDETKIRAKRNQNRCQKTKSKKGDVEDRLGAVLGRSWVVLGWSLESQNGVSPTVGETAFRQQSRFWKNKVSRGDSVPILGRFGGPRSSKMEAAESQKVS